VREVDRDNVKELGIPRMQSAKTVGKTYMEYINSKGGDYKDKAK
jgi:hypothetical protein